MPIESDLNGADLDVMAEAYHRALEQLPGKCTEPEITQSLIHHIADALEQGVRDADDLAKAALAQMDIVTR